ncbi:hypothetical protein BKA69DRAFT_1055714 [Paraphysoderma sedebokerense]|nr:hypothetical protein BKA69DRAFT_1055714 [Paraphysoderma sedebokerense]
MATQVNRNADAEVEQFCKSCRRSIPLSSFPTIYGSHRRTCRQCCTKRNISMDIEGITLTLDEIPQHIRRIIVDCAENGDVSSLKYTYRFIVSASENASADQVRDAIANGDTFNWVRRHQRLQEKWILHEYQCTQSEHIRRKLVPNEEKKRRSKAISKYPCHGKIKMRQFPDGCFHVEGQHLCIHPRKDDKQPPPQVLEEIKRNISDDLDNAHTIRNSACPSISFPFEVQNRSFQQSVQAQQETIRPLLSNMNENTDETEDEDEESDIYLRLKRFSEMLKHHIEKNQHKRNYLMSLKKLSTPLEQHIRKVQEYEGRRTVPTMSELDPSLVPY